MVSTRSWGKRAAAAAVAINNSICPHISDVLKNLDLAKMRAALKKRSCNVCLKIKKLLICIMCKQILCGGGNGHSEAHYGHYNEHSVYLNIESARLYCCRCSDYVEPTVYGDQLHSLREFVLYTPDPFRPVNQENKDIKNGKNNTKFKKLRITRLRTIKKAGLTNEGNSCFMNATWQALSNINLFILCIEKIQTNNNNDVNGKESNNGRILGDLCHLLIQLSRWKPSLTSNTRNSIISTRTVYEIICENVQEYREYEQNDAHAFLMFLLNKLHSELEQLNKRVPNPNRKTIVTHLFGSTLTSEVYCQGCKSFYESCEPYLDVSLEIPDWVKIGNAEKEPADSLVECLERFFGLEDLTEDKRYACSLCKSKQNGTKKIWISSVPNVLCLQLKRFRYEQNECIKVHTPIQFPMVSLDLSPFYRNKRTKPINKDDFLYDLSSIIVHKGESGGFGHYKSYIFNKNSWFECSDEKVYEVDPSFVENVEAYVLLYVQRNKRVLMDYCTERELSKMHPMFAPPK